MSIRCSFVKFRGVLKEACYLTFNIIPISRISIFLRNFSAVMKPFFELDMSVRRSPLKFPQ